MVWHGGEPLGAGRGAPRGADGAVRRRRRAPRADQRHPDRRRVVRVLRRARRAGRASASTARASATATRVDRAGRPAYDRIMRGVAALRRHGIPFSALCVVSDPRPGLAHGAVRVLPRPRLLRARHQHRGARGRQHPRQRAVRRRPCRRSGPSWSRPGGATRGSTCARSSGRCGTPAAVLAGDADDLLPRQLDPIPTVGQRRPGRAALAGAGGLHRPALRRLLPRQRARPAAGTRSSPRRSRRRPGGSPSSWPGWRLAATPARTSGSAAVATRPTGYFELGRFDGTVTDALPQQQDPPTGGSVGPCPRHS